MLEETCNRWFLTRPQRDLSDCLCYGSWETGLMTLIAFVSAAFLPFIFLWTTAGEECVAASTTLEDCGNDPTWTSLDGVACRNLWQWQPKGDVVEKFGDEFKVEHEDQVVTCFISNWEKRRPKEIPRVFEEPRIIQQEESIVLVQDVLTETELVALEVLSECAYDNLNHAWPYYQRRTNIGNGVEYTEKGAHECVYLVGLLQRFVPGVCAALSKGVRVAFPHQSDHLLGIRTAEYLRYEQHNKVGWHEDTGSTLTISLSLTNASDYEGGEFRIKDLGRGFKVDRGSAIVFDSTATHAVSDMTEGHRRVLVVEYWDDDDAPLGLPRPDSTELAKWKQGDFRDESPRFVY